MKMNCKLFYRVVKRLNYIQASLIKISEVTYTFCKSSLILKYGFLANEDLKKIDDSFSTHSTALFWESLAS